MVICPKCGFGRPIHLGRGSYKCESCGNVFKPKMCPNCGSYAMIHAGRGAYRCQNCNYVQAPSRTPNAPASPAPSPAPTPTDESKETKSRYKDFLAKFKPSNTIGFPRPFSLLLIIIALVIAFYPLPFLQEQPFMKFVIFCALVILNLTFERGSIGSSIFIIIIGVMWFLTQTPAGQSFIEEIGLKEQIDEAVRGVQYSGCYMTNAFNVNILSGGNLNEFCYKQVYGYRAKKEGCKDCVTFTPTPRRTGIPLQPTIIEIPISLQSNSNAPAKNINVKTIDLDSGKEGTIINDKCTVDKPCKLAVGDPEIQVRSSLILPCKNSIEYKVIVSYDYVVEGQAEFRIKQGQYATAKLSEAVVEGTSSSGPLSFGIKSDTLEYIVGEDREVFVNFYLFNEGRGVVKPKKTTVTQVPPRETAPLKLEECQGLAKVTPIDETHFDIESYGSIPSNGGDMVQCRFLLPDSVAVPYLTYKFIGVTDYSYSFEKKDSLMIDLTNYPCKMTGSRWRFVSGSSQSNWYSPDFDDAVWSFTDLPDKDWTDSDRYYRKSLVFIKGSDKTWLNVSSDDGAECYVNGNSLFSDTGSKHEHGKRNCWITAGLAGCNYWDYSYDISGYLKEGTNLIACHVHNVEGKGWFEVQ